MSPAFGSGNQTVFQIAGVVASMPHADNTPIDVRQLGLFTTLQRARDFLRTNEPHDVLQLDRAAQRLLFVRAAERNLGSTERDVRKWCVLSARGELLESNGEGDGGRAIGDTPRRRWNRGEIAACVSDERYRIGVIIAAPPPLDEQPGESDDFYLVGFADDDFAHDHARAEMLMEPLGSVPPQLRRRLQKRLDGISLGPGGSSRIPARPPQGSDIIPQDGWLPPRCCYQTDASFLFTDSDPETTGIPNAELWFSAGEFSRNPTPLGPRFLVVPGIRVAKPLSRAVPVLLTPPFHVLGLLPRKLASQVVQFAKQNQSVLLAHWNGAIGSHAVLSALQPLEGLAARAVTARRPASPRVVPPDAQAPSERVSAAKIICVEATIARPPFIDGVTADVYRMAHFEKITSALAWARSKAIRNAISRQTPPGRLLAIHVVARRVDAGPPDYLAHLLLAPDGSLRERFCADDVIAPWGGRAPARCRFKSGDIVAAISHDRYRLGIVLERPWAPSWVRRHYRPGLTRNDDVYQVGFVGDAPDHDHLSEGTLFPPTRVSKAIEQRLQARYRAHRAQSLSR